METVQEMLLNGKLFSAFFLAIDFAKSAHKLRRLL